MIVDPHLVSILLACVVTSSSLPNTVFWNNNWSSDLSGGELEGTVLFAQSQIIPSKNGISGDNQPHLTALRKTLVMFKPQDYTSSEAIFLAVRDVDGLVLSESITMNDPEDITKHDGWIDVGGVIPTFPPSLDNPHVVQGQSNLNELKDDKQAAKLTEILNAPNQEKVEIKTWNGSWIRDLYFPAGSTVPENSKIQMTCNSGYSVYLHYPNTMTGGWRTRKVTYGEVVVVVLANGNWVAKGDLEHNEYIFGHGFYSATLNAEWVSPGMTLEFSTSNDKIGILDGIKIGGITELFITAIDVGFLTEPRNEFIFRDDSTAQREYFETTPVSRLVVAQYESMHLTEVMLPTGKLYTSVSDDNGGWHSGDMRQHIGKLLISHGIDLANYGISSSWAQSESPHPFTCALLAAHNTVGIYQNGRIVHGGSGGNGMITLDSSIGNEFSHEGGHNYGLGHYVDGFEGSVHRSADKINSSWGWDSEKNVFIPNFKSTSTGENQCLDSLCQSPFLGKYQFGKDAMAGGSPLWGTNRFTLYTPNTSRKIQQFLENKAVWDPTSSTGFRKYNPSTKKMEEFINNDNNNKVPRLYRVPVTTIVGYYDPDSSHLLKSYVYPAMHGAYGFVYNEDGGTGDGSTYTCELVVETTNAGTLVYELSTAIDSKGMNKFHVNVATEDEPNRASLYCQNKLLASRALVGPKGELVYTTHGISFEDDTPPSDSPTVAPVTSPTVAPVTPPTVAPVTPPTVAPVTPPSVAPMITPTMYPTHRAPTPYPTAVPPTPYPTEKIGEQCSVKGGPCTKHSHCCKKKCNRIKGFCRK